jgi:hypothetical protein
MRSTTSPPKSACSYRCRWSPSNSIVSVLMLSIWTIQTVHGLAPHHLAKRILLQKAKSYTLTLPPEDGSSISTSFSRRSMLEMSEWNFLTVAISSFVCPPAVLADDSSVEPTTTTTPFLYKRQQDLKSPQQQLSYEIVIPSSMKGSAKPVKTHLDEINFLSEAIKGYQYGITVDPVRITSLKEVGRIAFFGLECDGDGVRHTHTQPQP